MRYHIEKGNGDEENIVIEFGVSKLQDKLKLAVLNFLETILFLQDKVIKNEIDEKHNGDDVRGEGQDL